MSDPEKIYTFLKAHRPLAIDIMHKVPDDLINQSERIYNEMGRPGWVHSIEWFIECTEDAIEMWRDYEVWLNE